MQDISAKAKGRSGVHYSEDERLSRQTRGFLAMLNSPSPPELEKLLPEDARNVLVEAQSSVQVDISGIEESTLTISSHGLTMDLVNVRPEGSEGLLPGFLFFHGGGWVLGDYQTHRRLVRDLVVESGCQAVFVEYSRAPEAVFPRQIDEAYAAAKWVAQNGAEVGVDPQRLGVAGNSAGGNLAAVTALRANTEGGPGFKCQILLWPVAGTDTDTDSFREFGLDRFLSKSLMEWMFGNYIPEKELLNDGLVALVENPPEKLKGLPPALILVAENDILRDEGEKYGRMLDEAGVIVTTIRYDGMIHDFGLLNALATLPQTRAMIRNAAAELRMRLG